MTLQCSHMLGSNLVWQLIENPGGSNPLKFVYTAVKSKDSTDGLGNVTVTVRSNKYLILA